MNIADTPEELRRLLADNRGRDRIALVPTMGCLHEGHLSLIRKARRMADIVVVSIYVNPRQFGPNEDFDTYPRTFEADVSLCEREGVDVLFHPASLYAEEGIRVSLNVEELDECLCGASRPGHFDGVVTVVNILFNIVQPDIAIFGEKDFQQLTIIRRMVSDLHMPFEVIAAETHREIDGLAMSSRNRYMNGEERQRAAGLFAALTLMSDAVASGSRLSRELIDLGRRRLAGFDIEPEYLEIRREADLKAADEIDDEPVRAFVAARVGKTRLIDNILLGRSKAGEFRPENTWGMP